MATDFTKAPKQIILDLINAKNPSLGLTDSLVDFGVPTVYSGAESRNTKLVATATVGSGYSGTRDLFYNRVDIDTVPGTRSKEYSLGNAVNISDLIAEINARYLINLTTDDYVDAALPTFDDGEPGETKDFVVTMKAGSLIFVNAVTFSLKRNDIPLEDAIVDNILDGLVYEQPA